MATAPKTRSRLTRDARRAQLLDAAAKLVIDRGAASVTMERLAEWAGVSKALPYSHFDNSDDVLIALYEQVVSQLGVNLLTAVENASADSDRVAVTIGAYFDTVAELGPILGAVTAPGSRTAHLADGDKRVGRRFVARLLCDHFDVPRDRADAIAPILLSALTGAIAAWVDRAATRTQAEEMSAVVMRSLIDAGH